MSRSAEAGHSKTVAGGFAQRSIDSARPRQRPYAPTNSGGSALSSERGQSLVDAFDGHVEVDVPAIGRVDRGDGGASRRCLFDQGLVHVYRSFTALRQACDIVELAN